MHAPGLTLRAPPPASAPVSRGSRAEPIGQALLAEELRQALAGNGLVLHYQPRLHLRSGRLVGAEALVRWPAGRKGERRPELAPSTFLPLAERNGLAVPLGGWVLRTACMQATGWAEGAVLSVNVSLPQLREGALLRQIALALRDSSLSPERLELELPEGVMGEFDEDTLFALAALRDRGLGLVLDNFGAGFASLAALRRLPLTAVKLDRSLVRALPAEPEDARIARALVEIGHALGLEVIAAGIETEAQRVFLAGIGCDQGQGYLLGAPAPEGPLPRPADAGPG